MSDLLQRLAGQAIGAPQNGALRIRSAMSVHALVPVGASRDGKVADGAPTLASAPRPEAVVDHAELRGQSTTTREIKTLFQAVEGAGEPDHHLNLAQPIEPRTTPAPSHRQVVTGPESRKHFEAVPQPLLGEVNDSGPAPAIVPAPQPAPTPTPAGNSQSEPTEVHVHIGRIEVIAAYEPAVPKKNRTPPVRNTSSLVDYLARRRKS